MRSTKDLVGLLTDEQGELTSHGRGLAWTVFALLFGGVLASLAGYEVVFSIIALLLILGVAVGVLVAVASTHS